MWYRPGWGGFWGLVFGLLRFDLWAYGFGWVFGGVVGLVFAILSGGVRFWIFGFGNRTVFGFWVCLLG